MATGKRYLEACEENSRSKNLRIEWRPSAEETDKACAEKPSAHSHNQSDRDTNHRFRSNIATKLIDTYKLIFTNGLLWAYNCDYGHFEILSKQMLNSYIENAIKDHEKNSSALTKEISAEILRRCYYEDYKFNPNHHLINFLDRAYNASNHTLERHSVSYSFNYAVNAHLKSNRNDWNNTTFCSFISTLCSYNKKKIKRLQEMCGLLISDVPFKGAIFFIGEHDTGKSTLARVLKYIVGETRTSSVPLEKMDNNFAISQLRNARLNIAGEISRSVKPQQLKTFKELTGGDSVYVDVKFEQPLSTIITAKHLFLGNFLPVLPYDDDSLNDRLNIIFFDNTIPRDKRDVNLTEKLIGEIDEFAIWCIHGLQRYISNHYRFTEDKDSKDYYTRHLRECNSARAFVDEFIYSGDDDDYIVNTDMYALYSDFCRDNELETLSKQQLFREVKLSYPKTSRGRVYINNERPQATYGIKFKNTPP